MISHYPLPPGGRLDNLWFELHAIGEAGQVFTHGFMYGVSGFIVPVLDPDAAVNVNTLWDTLVPKDLDVGSGVFDLDTAAADITPEMELGELDLSAVFEISGAEPHEIFRKMRFVTIATSAIGYEPATSGDDLFLPTDFWKSHIGRKFKVSSPSMILLGLSSPDLTQTTATVPLIPSEAEWFIYQFLEQALENMLMFVAGLVSEGTGTTPADEQATFVAGLLENDVFEEDATFFDNIIWTAYCLSTFQVYVPGRMQLGVITGE